MASEDEDFKRDFYRSLQDQGYLEPDDPRYVPLPELLRAPDGVINDPAARLKQDIEWAVGEDSFQLFSGFRGSGKTTQLLRLRNELRAEGYGVLYVNMEEYVETSVPLDHVTFLIVLVAALAEAAHGHGGDPKDTSAPLTTSSDRIATWWDGVKTLMTARGDTLDFGVNLGVVNFKAELRENPAFRQRVRAALEVSLAELRKQAHGFIDGLVADIRKSNPDLVGVVALVDSIDHADNRSSFDEIKQSVHSLFTQYDELIRLPRMHVVYTVPPYLKFLQSRNDGVKMLTTVKVRDKDSGEPYRPGVDALAGLVGQRGDWSRLVGDRSSLEALILLSGGHLRDLLRLVAEVVALADELPVRPAVIDHAVSRVRNTLLPLADDERDWLARVAETHGPGLQKAERWDVLAGLLDRHLILGYLNGSEWYDVHPLVRDVL